MSAPIGEVALIVGAIRSRTMFNMSENQILIILKKFRSALKEKGYLHIDHFSEIYDIKNGTQVTAVCGDDHRYHAVYCGHFPQGAWFNELSPGDIIKPLYIKRP